LNGFAKEINMPTSVNNQEDTQPPGNQPKPLWRVAVLANIKSDDMLRPADIPADAFADYDHIETIESIQAALESDGHETKFIPADENLPYALKEYKPDICFNIAEGLGGDAREAHAPALLELLKIPYTGSRVMTNVLALDKTLTKRIWRDRKLPVAPFQEFTTGEEPLRHDLRFPLFVKPAREGTGMGVGAKSKVEDEAGLQEQIMYVIENYKQPALVESFLPGREFTVGQLGRSDARLYGRHPEWYDVDGYHHFPIMELDSSRTSTPGIYSNEAKSKGLGDEGAPDYICPADLDPKLEKRLYHLALRAHKILGALDVSRVDFRLDESDKPRLMEINPLPGLTPDYSDLCLQASVEGIQYQDLILEILYLAAGRWGLLPPRTSQVLTKRRS
jgi:D-alanine-D-alanine ligase